MPRPHQVALRLDDHELAKLQKFAQSALSGEDVKPATAARVALVKGLDVLLQDAKD